MRVLIINQNFIYCEDNISYTSKVSLYCNIFTKVFDTDIVPNYLFKNPSLLESNFIDNFFTVAIKTDPINICYINIDNISIELAVLAVSLRPANLVYIYPLQFNINLYYFLFKTAYLKDNHFLFRNWFKLWRYRDVPMVQRCVNELKEQFNIS
jgi:hypothetical protein